MNDAAPPHAMPPHSAPILRRSVAWLIDALMVSAIATAASWRWTAAALSSCASSLRALQDAVSARVVEALLAGAQPAAMLRELQHDPALLLAAQRVQDALVPLLVSWGLAYAVFAFAWHVAGDLSSWQGSAGKRLLGLRVEAIDGRAPTGRQAALREAGSALSWLTLNLGHVLALVPPRRQSLHDRLARTRVVQASMPATGDDAAAATSPSSICRQAK